MVGKIGLEPTTRERPDLQSGAIPIMLYLPDLIFMAHPVGFEPTMLSS